MDRKGDLMSMHISASPEAAALAPSFKVFAEEGFLLTLTNKGTYNRSRRDSEALTETVALSVEEGRLAVAFSDVKVLLDQNIAQSRCTCPSGTTCRHILMALFAAEELARQGGAEAAADIAAEPDFAELEQMSLETLKKEGGKKNYDAALGFMGEAFGVEFTGGQNPGELLSAHIDAFDITVYFPRQESVSASICKCGEKGLCLHRLIAILAFLKERDLIDLEAELGTAASPSGVSSLALMESARAYTASLFEKGLISADDTDIEGARQLSLKLEGAGIGNLSRLFRGIATDMENMGTKNTAFDPLRAFSTLSRIYTTLSLILARPADTDVQAALIEKSRSVYRTMPQGQFIGLGAHPWQTRSGYAGVTALVYHREKNALRSYTVSMADFYEGTQGMASFRGLGNLAARGEHWDAALSLDTISRSCFTLRNFKINEEGRLSSSKGTHYFSQGKTGMEQIEEMSAAFSAVPADDPADHPAYDYFGKKGGGRYRLVLAEGMGDCEYDRVNQRLTFTLHTGAGELPAFIRYSAINKGAIQYIEDLAKADFSRRWFIGEADRQGFIPLSMITGLGVENFFFSTGRPAAGEPASPEAP
jgi:hypothetical protein